MHKLGLFAIALSILACACTQANIPLYQDRTADIEDRVEDALSRLTLEEKIALIHAQSKFSSAGVPRLGIPEVWMSDGPFGVREEPMWDSFNDALHTNDSCTANPTLTCLAATWNREMAAKYGDNVGAEAKYRNKTVMLGPGVNMFRTPLNGRNFEYMGEDPYLCAQMVVPYIRSVQSYGVASCVKHYALNNQEAHRHEVEICVDDRALNEIYLPAFRAAVREAGVWCVMGAYNKYKGEYCCHNQYLLNDILKNRWQFDGAVVSDWGGATDSEQSIMHGLDMEFGTWTDGLREGRSNAYAAYCLADQYLEGIIAGKYGTTELDDKVRRVLRLIFRTTMSGNAKAPSFASPEHFEVSKEIALEGIVLLKNEKELLPVNVSDVRKILVVGDNATAEHIHGGGSMYLKTKYEITPLQGIRNLVGDKAEVKYVRGYAPYGYDIPEGTMEQADRLRKEALEAAADADVVLFFGGHNRWAQQDCEGMDKVQYDLPYNQGELISALAAVNPRLCVTIISGTAMAMPWLDSAAAVVYGWYPGSEGGNALAQILFGEVCPSGKLPFTIARRLEDYPAHAFGAYDPSNNGVVTYKEGIWTGYRGFEHFGVEPLFPFGYGLSYTGFKWDNAKISSKRLSKGTLTVSVDVTNTGKMRGAEVVQLYISDLSCSYPRPEKELKNFEKVWLDPGQTKTVKFKIDASALEFYNPQLGDWVAENGEFRVILGSSSDSCNASFDFTFAGGVQQIVNDNEKALGALLQRVCGPQAEGKVTFRITDAPMGDHEVFSIGPAEDGKTALIEASTVSAASAGLGWYLNHYCHVNVCWNRLSYADEKLEFPVPDCYEMRDSHSMLRYYLNYCTYSYSMAFWDWDRWQKEIDWMALHGVNMPLCLVGADCVWHDVLLELGYSEAEVAEFIAGPGFQAWWLMNNLQGWGGPNPSWWYERESKLCASILDRMRSLGMTPVLPGYSGMVPGNASEKLGLKVSDPGMWCNVFRRPAFLDPTSPEFERISDIYYKYLQKYMGKSSYYSMDPFHEGGDISGTDLKMAYRSIDKAMRKAVPDAKWVIQSWNENPRKEALEALPYGNLIVLDLFSDGDPKWQSSYGGHRWIYCMLHNFGGRSGIHGRLSGTMEGWSDALRQMRPTLAGVGATPEGLETNPVLYDALFELPWLREDEYSGWLRNYTLARYGVNDSDADAAWTLVANSALNCRTGQQGTSEPVVCAAPSFDVDRVSSWSTCVLSYDPAQLVKAGELMSRAAGRLGSNRNFIYDCCDLQRQIITDSCQTILKDIKRSYEAGDVKSYDRNCESFLGNIIRLDDLLRPFPDCNYDSRAEMARSVCDGIPAATDADRDWMEWNLRTLVTTWTSAEDAVPSGLLDYSNRQWSGLLKDYYYPRWKKFFDEKRKDIL